jgi:hypothetical protein
MIRSAYNTITNLFKSAEAGSRTVLIYAEQFEIDATASLAESVAKASPEALALIEQEGKG